MINFITVCTDAYSAEYAIKSYNMFKRNFKHPFQAYCVTDKGDELADIYTVIERDPNLSGWWNKLSIFEQPLKYEYTFYLDLDIMIANDLTTVLEYALQQKRQMAGLKDSVEWLGTKFGSAMMVYHQVGMGWLYRKFIENYQEYIKIQGGDQIWLNEQLADILYLDTVFPHLAKSVKFDLGNLSKKDGSTYMSLPSSVDENIILINCHGRPKPHELVEMGWPPAKNTWL